MTDAQTTYLSQNRDAAVIYRYLKRFCVGVDKALPRTAAPGRFGLSDRRVRDVVSELGIHAFPVTASPDGGFFYAEDPAQLESSCLILEARAKTESDRAKGLRLAQGNLAAARAHGRAVVARMYKNLLPENQEPLFGAVNGP